MEATESATKPYPTFVTNVLSYGSAGILGRVFRAIQEFVIRVILPPNILGGWSLVMVLVNFATISELGVFSAARRELPILYAKNEFEQAAEFRSVTFNLHFMAKLIMGLLVMMFCLFQNGFVLSYFKVGFAAAVLIVLAAFGENYSCFYETAQQYTKLGRALSFYWPTYTVLMIIGAYLGGVPGLVVANALALLLQGWFMRSAMFVRLPAKYFYWDWARVKALLAFAIPFFITDLPINLMYVLDSLFVAKYFSVALLAIYTTGKMISLQAGQLPMWINNVLEIRLTFLSFQKAPQTKQIGKETVYYMLTYLFIIMPMMMVGLVAVSWYLLSNFLPKYNSVCTYLPILLASLYCMPKMTPLRNFLLIEKNFKTLAYINYISLAIMVLGYLGLMIYHQLDLSYVAIVYVISFFIYLLLILFSLAKKALGIRQVFVMIASLIISIVVTFYAIHVGYHMMTAHQPPTLMQSIYILSVMMLIIVPMTLVGVGYLFLERIKTSIVDYSYFYRQQEGVVARTVTLCSSFSLSYLLLQIVNPKKSKQLYFIDLYAKSHGLLIWLLIKFFGRERLAKLFTQFFGFFHVYLMMEPHARAIKDYHLLNIKAHEKSCHLALEWVQTSEASSFIFPRAGLSAECQRSLVYKSVADRLWHLVENIDVLKYFNYQGISIRIKRHYLPVELVKKLATSEKITVQYEPCYARFLVWPFLTLYLGLQWLSKSLPLLLPSLRRPKEGAPKIAVELTSPYCLAGRATHADYMLTPESAPEDFVFYVRGERDKFFNQLTLKTPVKIVHLSKLKPNRHELMLLLFGYGKLLKGLLIQGMSIYEIVQRLSYARLAQELTTFFRHYPVQLHVYNTFANAQDIGVRLDSGLVTGICRQNQVASLSYQTRVIYLHSYYFYRDVFDSYCSWGETWQALMADKSDVQQHHLIGNVYCKEELRRSTQGALQTILLFNSDIEAYFPSHHPPSYNIDFFEIVLKAVSALPSKPPAVFLKAKNTNEAKRFLEQAYLQQLQKQCNVNITILGDEAHDIWGAITRADVVVSIGFATPGICALGLGKKSIYVTPYRYRYNEYFTEQCPVIAHDASELCDALQSTNVLSTTDSHQLDAFCDGKSAHRLYALCMKVIKGEFL